MEATSSDPAAIKKMVEGTKELGGKIQEVKSLGVVIGEEEFDELQGVSDKLEVELLISDLEERTLWTEEQKEILNQMKELVEEGKYSEALVMFNAEFNKPASPEPMEEPIDESEEQIEEPIEKELIEEVTEEPTE
jgi:F0F1-type ATP synthase gamma subunit